MYGARPPNDNIIVYGDGLLLNPPDAGPLVWSGNSSSLAIGVGNCSFVAFSSVSGMGTVQLEDGTGTATARAAQLWDLPGTKVFTDYGGYYANGSTYGTDQNGLPFAGFFSVQPGQEIEIVTSWSASYRTRSSFGTTARPTGHRGLGQLLVFGPQSRSDPGIAEFRGQFPHVDQRKR